MVVFCSTAGVSGVSSMTSSNKAGPVKLRGGAVILSCSTDDAEFSYGETDYRVPESLAGNSRRSSHSSSFRPPMTDRIVGGE